MAHVVVHCFMDGRDVPPKSGAGYLEELEEVRARAFRRRLHGGDRQHLRTLLRHGPRQPLGARRACVACRRGRRAAARTRRRLQVMAVLVCRGRHRRVRGAGGDSRARGVRDGDAVVFFNFRPDRAREFTRALVDPAFSGFDRGVVAAGELRVPDRVRPGDTRRRWPSPRSSPKTCWPTCWPRRACASTTSPRPRSTPT